MRGSLWEHALTRAQAAPCRDHVPSCREMNRALPSASAQSDTMPPSVVFVGVIEPSALAPYLLLLLLLLPQRGCLRYWRKNIPMPTAERVLGSDKFLVYIGTTFLRWRSLMQRGT